MKRYVIALAALTASAGSSHATSHCYVTYIKYIPGVTNNGQMFVQAGTTCKIVVRDASGGVVRGPEVKQRPANGTLAVDGTGLAYTPKKGFLGKDRFEYTRHFLDPRTGAALSGGILVEVTVQAGRVL